jgi:hypothetical protein
MKSAVKNEEGKVQTWRMGSPGHIKQSNDDVSFSRPSQSFSHFPVMEVRDLSHIRTTSDERHEFLLEITKYRVFKEV